MSDAVPYLPFSLWLIASACLLLLLIVIFGYHLYQRSRIRALVGDSASVGALAARKEALEADVRALRQWLAEQQTERLKMEAERHSQEMCRADLARMNRILEDRRREGEALSQRVAEIDLMLARRKNALTHLDAEITSLEQQRRDLGPLEKYTQELRLEIDSGKIRLAQMAEQELRAEALQHKAQQLEDEIEEMRKTLEPMRHEKQKLRQFIEQARHAATVKNEQLLEQKQALRGLQRARDELLLARQTLQPEIERLQAEHTAKSADLAMLEDNLRQERQEKEASHARAIASLEKALQSRREEAADAVAEMRQELQHVKGELAALLEQKRGLEGELMAMAARKALWESELAATRPKPARRQRPVAHARAAARKIPRKSPARSTQIFCKAG